jgi:hypothetical protein
MGITTGVTGGEQNTGNCNPERVEQALIKRIE